MRERVGAVALLLWTRVSSPGGRRSAVWSNCNRRATTSLSSVDVVPGRQSPPQLHRCLVGVDRCQPFGKPREPVDAGRRLLAGRRHRPVNPPGCHPNATRQPGEARGGRFRASEGRHEAPVGGSDGGRWRATVRQARKALLGVSGLYQAGRFGLDAGLARRSPMTFFGTHSRSEPTMSRSMGGLVGCR